MQQIQKKFEFVLKIKNKILHENLNDHEKEME